MVMFDVKGQCGDDESSGRHVPLVYASH